MPLLFVNGTLMTGFPLHRNLDGARLIGTARTTPCYRLFSIDDRHPGMFRDSDGGASLEGELYDVPDDVLDVVVDREPPNLYIGCVELEDGQFVPGVLYPRELTTRYREITSFGGWRAWVAEMFGQSKADPRSPAQ